MPIINMGDSTMFSKTPVSVLEKEVMGCEGVEKVEDLDDSST